MTGREIHIHITIGRRSLIVLGVVAALLAGGVVFAIVGTRDASAAATFNRLCVKTNGTVVQRTACLAGERTLAAGTYRTTPLTSRALKKGLNYMPKPRAADLRAREGGEPPEVILDASQMFQSNLFAFTVRYDVPASWTGTIRGTCPDYAPVKIAGGFYSPEWAPILDGQGVPYGNLEDPPVLVGYSHSLGDFILPGPAATAQGQVWVSRDRGNLNQFLAQAQAFSWPRSPADPFTLYVTQVCGSIVALTPTG